MEVTIADVDKTKAWLDIIKLTVMHVNLGAGAIERIAKAYKEKDNQFKEISPWQMQLCRQLICKQFALLTINKVVYFDFVTEDPYDYKLITELSHDWMQRKIKVNVSGNESDFWGPVYNLFFRAIHDWIHVTNLLDFNFEAEVKAFYAQIMFSDEGKQWFPDINMNLYERVLRSEIVYQAAYKEYYGEFHVPTQKIILIDL